MCRENIANIQRRINPLPLITKVATGERISGLPLPHVCVSVCRGGGRWWDIAVDLTLFGTSQCRVPQGLCNNN